jgi:rhodanese-related sulfurtransferase
MSKSAKRKTARKASAKNNQRLLWIGAAVVILVVIGAVLVLSQNNQPATTANPVSLAREVSVQEAATLRDKGAFVLDVRQPDEWADYHLPDSTLIPLDQLPNRLSEVPRDQTILVVCRSGNRSAEGRDILLNAGFTSVTSMAGGLTQWRSSGLHFVEG